MCTIKKSLLFEVLAELDSDEILVALGVAEFNLPTFITEFLPDLCTFDPEICAFDLAIIEGPSVELNMSRLSYYLTYEPNPTSVKNMVHWAQSVRGDTFQKFDYGTAGNLIHYNQTTPPQYSLGNLPKTLPIALFTGGNDYLADPIDVARLISELPVPPVLHHNEPTFAHVDYIWAEDAPTTIYPLILQLLQKYNQ